MWGKVEERWRGAIAPWKKHRGEGGKEKRESGGGGRGWWWLRWWWEEGIRGARGLRQEGAAEKAIDAPSGPYGGA